MIRHSRYARSGTGRTSLAAGRRLGWVLVIVAAVLLPVVAWGTHVGAQATETVCSAGLAVQSGEICTYPGTTVEFSVDSSGGGRFLIFTGGSSIELKDADINGVIYNFVAKAQRDGTWLIETVGDSTAPTMTPTPTPTPTPGAGQVPPAPAAQRYEYSGSSIVLSWDASAGATSYTVYYDDFFGSDCRLGRSGSASFCEEFATGLTGTSYTHASPDLDKNYYWLVACNSYGCSAIDSTNPVQLGGSPPAAPANQRYEYDGSSIVLTWDASTGADSYTVYYDDFFGSDCRLGRSGSASFCEELTTGLTGTSYTHASPDLDKNYYWLVACNSYGCSEVDSTNPVQLGGSPPAAPANQRYEYDGSSIVLTWDASTGADSYTVYYDDFFGSTCRLGSSGPSFCEELATGLTGTSYTQASPDLDKNYYWLVACNSYGCSAIDSTNPVQLGGSPPAAPANQRYEYDGSSIVLTWDASTGADSYTVYYDDFFGSTCRLGSSGPSFCEELATGLTGTSYTQASPDLDKNYYWLVACNSYGCSAIDSTNPVQLGGSPPAAPANQRYEYDGSSIVLSWDASAGADSYTVYYDDFFGSACRLGSRGPSFCEELATGLTGTSYTHASPDAGRNFYWLVACNSYGCSEVDSTNPVQLGGSPPVAPANQRYEYDGSSIVLSWDASAGADSYTVYYDDFFGSACRLGSRGPSFCEELATGLTGASYTHASTDRDRNFYWLVACNSYGCSRIESSARAELVGSAPTTPTQVTTPDGETRGSGPANPVPDLVVGTPTVSSATPRAGTPFSLSATVRNQGTGSASSTILRYYRSSGPTITTADTAVGSEAVPGLGTSQSADESVSLTAPATPGTYYYGSCVASVSGEADTTNNCSSAVTVTVGAASVPDLVVDAPTVSSASPPAGSSFTLDATVRNEGNGSSTPTTLRFYRSSDPTITSADVAVGRDPVLALGAAQNADGSVSLTAPSTPGTYYYGACVDAARGEADTTNNCSPAVTVTAGAPPAPGLVVDPPTVSELAPAAGASFTLSATVRNQGNGASSATTVRYYRSGDPAITTSDTAVGADPVSALDASQSAHRSVSLTAPDTAGTYYYGACVDAVSGEADTTNNCSSAVTVTVGAAPAPDAVVGTPAVSTATPDAGAPLTLSATVHNQGNGASGSTRLQFYRSSDSTITSADSGVGSDAVPGLSASESAGGELSLTAPAAPGTYYYGACVDPVSGESDTTNNCSSAVTVTVGAPPAPDPVVSTPTVSSATPRAGATFTLSATVRNQGSGDADIATTLRYYRSSDPTISSADTGLGSDPVPALGASESAGGSVSLTAPSTPGTYYYGACVDAVSGESDTTNNCSSAVTVKVGAAPAPGLVVDAPTVSELAPAAGASFTLSATVRNQGNGVSGSTTLRFHQSDDSTITTADTAVGSDRVSRLGPSQSEGGSVSLTAPATPGTYYYGACVDAVSGEVDTANNCSSAVAVTVVEAPAPDLVVEPPTVSTTSVREGRPLTVSATVRNQGDASSSATTLSYYVSSDSTITTLDELLDSDPVPALSAAQGADNSTSPLGAPTPPGTYYFGACVDAVLGEADTGNNCSSAVAVVVTARDAPAPDLLVDTPTVSESAPAPGASWTLSANVRNQGDGSSSPTTLRYYESSDSTITTADTAVGSDPVPGLGASASEGGSLSLTAPDTPGTYYYGACVDVDTVSDEANAYNNCSSAVSVTVTPVEPPAPDLVVDAPTVSSASPPAGASFTLSATVRNQGDGSSSPTTLRYYYEASLLFSTIAETAVGSDPVSGLDASQNTAGSVSLTTPATPGRYDYWACVDVVTSESDATNNCSSAVEVRVAPDLVVEPPTVSDSAPAAGASITLSATVRNVGNGHSWPTTLRYYRSSNPTITTAGTALGSDSAPYLDAARSAGGSVSLAAPSTPGTYYYGACVDTDDTESDTTNNCSSAVAVTVAPDLAVDAPTVSESAEAAGANLTLSATVRNQGNSASGSTTLHFYRSGDSTITTADTAVGADLVSGLDPAEGTDGSVSLAEADPQDRYYYGACVDAVSGELDTTNNCSAAVALGPDLVVDTPTVGTSIPTVGEQFRIVVAVRNQGSTTPAATRSFVSFYRSTDSTITSSDERIHTSSTSALSPSETAYLYGDPRAPSTPGTYYYGACVSPTSGESNTANNCSPALEILVGRPDLVLDTLSVSPDSPETGSDFELRIDALHNHGNSWSGFTTLRFYLSADALVTSTDTELAYDLVGPMEPSSSYDIGTAGPFQAPSTPGTYYYGVCADAVLGEADTTNNCSVVAVTVRLPDLVMLLPTVSDSTPTAGARFTLYATVVNRGGSRSQAASLVYYRSTDETITREDSWMGSDFVGGLEPHEVRHESVTLTAPSTAGTYYYGVCMRRGAAEYCTEAVEVTAGDAQPSPLVLRTECFVFQNQDFVRFTVTARVPLTSLAVSTYRVEGRTNTRHLVKRVEVGDLAAGSSYSRLTSRYFPAHLQRHLTTCTAGVEGYASVRPGFDPPAIMVPDPGPQTPADQPPVEQPPVEQTPIYPTYEATTQLWFDLHNASTVGALDYNTSCGVSQGVPCPWQDHISWWSSQPAHIQPCAFTTCDFSRD